MTIALDPTDRNRRPRPATYPTRAAVCYGRAHRSGASRESIAKDLFEDDRVTPLILRAASTQARISDPSWAGAIGQQVVSDLIAAATTISAAADLIDPGLKVDLTGRAQVTVPGRVVDAVGACAR
jgi:hypothetical protein